MESFVIYTPILGIPIQYLCQKRIRMPSKFFTKPYFRINPAGKPEMPSWKNITFQQENYFFSVGNLFFSSRAVFCGESGLFLNYIWLISVHIVTNVPWMGGGKNI